VVPAAAQEVLYRGDPLAYASVGYGLFLTAPTPLPRTIPDFGFYSIIIPVWRPAG
jgi:hypothetical protein